MTIDRDILPGEKQKVGDINDTRRAVKAARIVDVVPPLTMQRTPAGTVLGIKLRPSTGSKKAAKGSTDNPKILTWDPTAAPASDSWNREEDKIALQETEIRGIRYDEETHRLQVKYRVKLYDSLGMLYSVSAETAWTDIVQFVEHSV